MEKSRHQKDAERAIRMHQQSRIGVRSYYRFHENPGEPLNTKHEMTHYINSWDTGHLRSIQGLYGTISNPSFPEQLSAYAITPVLAGQEIDTLHTTLTQYEKQTADPQTWALMLLVNHTERNREHISQHQIRKTFDVIDEFTGDNPQITTHVAQKIYSNPPPMGTIRADAWDTAQYSLHTNDGAYTNDLIGISHDADMPWMSPEYIEEMIRTAREHPEADLLTCELGWHQVGDPESDANKLLRYLEYVLDIQRNKLGIIGLSEANTAIRMASYAGISGFGRLIKLCEMWDLRERLSIARGLTREDTSRIAFIDGIRLETDSRRLYQAAAKGIAPGDAWHDLPFLTGHDPVRDLDTTTLANLPIDPAVLETMLSRIEKAYLWRLERNERERLQKIGRQVIGLSHHLK